MIYSLHKRIALGVSLEEGWEFMQNPANLNMITPPELEFNIISPIPKQMYDGLLIEYSIRIPGLGKQRWLTEIKHVRQLCSFVDEQRCGPFHFWYHYHKLTASRQTLISEDTVHYVMPASLLGRAAHRLYFHGLLRRIFSYREEQLQQLFPPKN